VHPEWVCSHVRANKNRDMEFCETCHL
jgi:hypothetical protein